MNFSLTSENKGGMTLKKAVIIPNVNKDSDLSVTEAVINKIFDIGIECYLSDAVSIFSCESKVHRYSDFPLDAELIIVVGGDGSVIDASRYAVAYDIPILAINLGRVGYLAEVEPEELSVLKLISGDYHIFEKMLLTVDCEGVDCSEVYAVNDVVISHEDYLGISEIGVDDSIGNSLFYRADGVILSTPQGSTAYSLSAGGPIVAHGVDCILLTPVCTHSFFNRSVIFNSSERICVTNRGADTLIVTVDGRLFRELKAKERCYISRAKKRLRMLTFSENSMFRNLFRKMKLLEDID